MSCLLTESWLEINISLVHEDVLKKRIMGLSFYDTIQMISWSNRYNLVSGMWFLTIRSVTLSPTSTIQPWDNRYGNHFAMIHTVFFSSQPFQATVGHFRTSIAMNINNNNNNKNISAILYKWTAQRQLLLTHCSTGCDLLIYIHYIVT